MTYAHIAWVLGGVLALLLIYGAARWSRRRTYRMSHLTDLSRGDIDPDWERTRKTMTTPIRRHWRDR